MKKVIVIGCCGAGKSTFARKLRDMTGLPLYYLDMIWHKPDRTNVSREEFDAALQNILSQGSWIIDGNYQRTLDLRLAACDTVFFFDLPVEECLAGVEARRGTVREDMPWVELEADEEFLQFIRDFPQHTLPKIKDSMNRCAEDSGKEIHVFKTRKDAENYLNNLVTVQQLAND